MLHKKRVNARKIKLLDVMNSVLESSYAWTGSFVEAFNTLACDVANYIYTSFTETPNVSDSSSSSTSSNSEAVDGTPVTPSEKTLPSIPQVLQEAASFFAADDFQILLLKIFLAILFCNCCLIYIAWHVYGERISERFMNPNLSPEELKKRVSELKLPTEHSQRYA